MQVVERWGGGISSGAPPPLPVIRRRDSARVPPTAASLTKEAGMEVRSFEAIAGALNSQGVRYLVVGGMAVVAHGHGRMTHDLDLVISLDLDDVRQLRMLADEQ